MSKVKAVVIQPITSLNLRTIMTNKHISKEIAPPAKTLPIQPRDETFFDETTLFHLEGVPFADDLYEDVELDHNAFNRLSTLLKPDTPLGVAVSQICLPCQMPAKLHPAR